MQSITRRLQDALRRWPQRTWPAVALAVAFVAAGALVSPRAGEALNRASSVDQLDHLMVMWEWRAEDAAAPSQPQPGLEDRCTARHPTQAHAKQRRGVGAAPRALTTAAAPAARPFRVVL